MHVAAAISSRIIVCCSSSAIYGWCMSSEYIPTPTEVIAAWIPHDARWHTQARTAARRGLTPLRQYVTGLVQDYRDGDQELTDPFDRRSIDAVAEDLELGGGFRLVRWDEVHDAMLVPDRSGLWPQLG